MDYGIANDKVTMVRQGLTEGEKVVITTATALTEGQEVQVEEVAPTAAASPMIETATPGEGR